MKKTTIIALISILLLGATTYSIYAYPRREGGRWERGSMMAGYRSEFCPGFAYSSTRGRGFLHSSNNYDKPITKNEAIKSAKEYVNWHYGNEMKTGKIQELTSVFEIEVKDNKGKAYDYLIVDKYTGRVR